MMSRPGSEVPACSSLGVSTFLLSLEVSSPWFSFGDNPDSFLLGREEMGKDDVVQLRFSYRLPGDVIICSL